MPKTLLNLDQNLFILTFICVIIIHEETSLLIQKKEESPQRNCVLLTDLDEQSLSRRLCQAQVPSSRPASPWSHGPRCCQAPGASWRRLQGDYWQTRLLFCPLYHTGDCRASPWPLSPHWGRATLPVEAPLSRRETGQDWASGSASCCRGTWSRRISSLGGQCSCSARR